MATLTERLLLIVDADSRGAARGLDDLSSSAKKADRSMDDLSTKGSRLGDSLKAGLALGAGAIIGGGLADAVIGIGKAYLEAGRGIQFFQTMTNSSLKESQQFMGLAQSIGLDLNDLVEIVAEASPKFSQFRDELKAIGAEQVKNSDGSINMAASLISVLEGLQGMEDGVDRTSLAMKIFGEEGSKQFAAIYNGSKPVKQALEDLRLDVDPRKAQEFQVAMQELSVTGRNLGFAIADAVLPALTKLAEIAGPVADALGEIPPELLLIGAGFAAFSKFGPGFTALGAGVTALASNFQYLSNFTTLGGQEIGKLGAASMTAKAGLSSLGGAMSAALGGPIGITLAATAVAYTVLNKAVDAFKEKVAEQADSMVEAVEAGEDYETALKKTSQEIVNSMSTWEHFGAEVKGGTGGILGALSPVVSGYDAISDAVTGTDDAMNATQKELDAQVEKLGLLALASNKTKDAQKDLTDAIIEAESGQGDFSDVVASAEAMAEAKTREEEVTRKADEALQRALGTYDMAKASLDGLTVAQTTLKNGFFTGTTGTQEFADAMAEVVTTEGAAERAQEAYNEALERGKRSMFDWVQLQRDAAGLNRDLADAQDTLITSIETYEETQDDATTRVDEHAAAYRGIAEAAAGAGDAAIAAAQLTADQYGPGSELDASIAEQITQLQAMRDTPGISPEAQAEIDNAIVQLQTLGTTAGAVPPANVVVTTTGTAEAGAAISALTVGPDGNPWSAYVRTQLLDAEAAGNTLNLIANPENPRQADILVQTPNAESAKGTVDDVAEPGGAADREALIRVESRNGPAVIAYLDSIDDERLAIVRVESRNGPAVIDYLNSIANPSPARLALIYVESRNGPAVDQYLDDLASNFGAGRTARIAVSQSAPAPTAAAAPTGYSATALGAVARSAPGVYPLAAATSAPVVIQNTYRITNENALGVNPIEVGRATVNAIRSFESAAGKGWRAS